ncbi:MAG: RNA polymerase sigma factor [Bacteroidota bacterium]
MVRNEEELQQRLRNNDRQALREVYLRYKGDFLNFFRSKGSQGVDLEDIYHESVVVLHQNFVMKQLQLEKASIKSYLFAIGKNKVLQVFKGIQRLDFTDSVEEIPHAQDLLDQGDMTEERKRKLAYGYKMLGAKCRELLNLYYYRGFTIKEMVASTSYKDENTVKSYKSRCMKKLKELTRVQNG